jgi:hypothetical protein
MAEYYSSRTNLMAAQRSRGTSHMTADESGGIRRMAKYLSRGTIHISPHHLRVGKFTWQHSSLALAQIGSVISLLGNLLIYWVH